MWACRGEETSLSPHCSHRKELMPWMLFVPVSARQILLWSGMSGRRKGSERCCGTPRWSPSALRHSPPQQLAAVAAEGSPRVPPGDYPPRPPPLTGASSLIWPLISLLLSIGSQHPMTGWCQRPKCLAAWPPSGWLWLAILASRLLRDQWVGCCDLHRGSTPTVCRVLLPLQVAFRKLSAQESHSLKVCFQGTQTNSQMWKLKGSTLVIHCSAFMSLSVLFIHSLVCLFI